MTITFAPLLVTDTAAAGRSRAAFGSRGYGRELTAGEGAGRSRVGFRSRGYGDMEDEVVVPTIPANGLTTAFFGASGVGSETIDVGGAGGSTVAFKPRGYGLAVVSGDTPGAGRNRLQFVPYGRGLASGTAYAFLVEQPAEVTGYSGWQFASMGDRILARAGLDPTLGMLLREAIALAAGTKAPYEGTAALSDSVAFGDGMTYLLHVAIAEGLVMADGVNVDMTAFVRVVARLLVSGSATSYIEAVVQVLDTLVLAALADAMAKGEIAETAVMSDTIAGLYQAFATILERLVASDALKGTSTAYVLIDERVALSADLTHTAELAVLLSDSVGFAATLSIDNGEYIAWVMNTEGDKPVSRYTQFPFNSMAKVGGRYVACDSTGLHWMDGNDDSGEAIKARLRAGMQAMGTRREKRLPEAFLYVRTDGELRLQVIQVDADTGEKVAGWFKVLTRPSSNARETRAKTGRGWKAVEFDIVLENIDGADFDLTSIEPRPLNLDRRTRG